MSFELLGFGDLSFFITLFLLLDHCLSHCSIKWLWKDLISKRL